MYRTKLQRLKEQGGYSVADLVSLRKEIQESDSKTKDADLWEIDNMISNIPDSDCAKKEYKKAESIHRIAGLVKALIGERSIRRTAEDTGVAASYITGIMKEKYLPSAEILRRLVAPESKPQNGIMLEDLMIAAGYQNNYIDEPIISDVIEELRKQEMQANDENSRNHDTLNKIIAYQNDLLVDKEEDRRIRRRAFLVEKNRFEKMAKGLIYQGLVEKGIMFKMSEEEAVGIRGFRPDVVVKLNNPLLDEWWFEFKYLGAFEGQNQNRGIMNARQLLGRYIFIEPNDRRKISVVLNSVEDFDMLKSFKDKLSFRGELSAILVDMENYALIDEVYLSHWNVQDRKSEIRIMN